MSILIRVSALIRGYDTDLIFVRGADHLIAVEHQCLTGGDAETGGASLDHRLNRRHTDYGDVKTHVLIRLRYFHHRQPSPGQPTCPADRFVSAFHCLDRHTRATTHNDRLTQIETRNFASDLEPVFNIFTFLLGRFTTCERAALRQ